MLRIFNHIAMPKIARSDLEIPSADTKFGTLCIAGSPHVHMVIWIKNAPDFTTAEGMAAAPAFIDRYISTQLPVVSVEDPASQSFHNLVKKVQTHDHRPTCQRTVAGEQICRFNMPKPVCAATRLKLDTDVGLRSTDWYVTQRGLEDIMVVPYNPAILKRWGANMDIQVIGVLGGGVAGVRG